MRLRRLCFAILALRFFLMDPIGAVFVRCWTTCVESWFGVLVNDLVKRVFDDAFGPE